MHDIKASVILAEKVEKDNIQGIIQSLPSGKDNIIWMYLTIKTNLSNEDELKIGFDIIKVDDKDGFGFELGEFVVKKTKNKKKSEESLNRLENSKEVKSEERRSIFPYADVYIIGQKFPPLPDLKKGFYEFVVYEKDGGENHILDTFQFNVE